MMPPPQVSFRQGQPQAITSVRFQALLSDLNTPFLGNDDQQPSQNSNLRISSQATESNQGLNSNLMDFYTSLTGLPVSATSTSNKGTSKYSIASWEAPDHQASVASSALFDVAGSYLASTVFATFIEALDDKASLDAVVNNQFERPITLRSPTLNGSISIACTTTTGSTPGVLSGADKISPGWLSNVNWSADWNGGNGWDPATTKTTTAGPASTYTPDKDKSVVSGGIAGGDPDLRKFVVTVGKGGNVLPNVNWDFKLTFDDKVRVYKDVNTKIAAPVANGDIFSPTEGGPGDKSMTFYLEGITASTAFRDIELKVEYVGGTISMNSTIDIVKVTVIGVEQTGMFSGPQESDDKERFTEYDGSRDENGQISWDLARYLIWEADEQRTYCMYYHNCMEMQGEVLPNRDTYISEYYGVTDDPRYPDYPKPEDYPDIVPLVKFSQNRDVYAHFWLKGGELGATWVEKLPQNIIPAEWSPDDIIEDGQANVPTLSSHIYYADCPGPTHRDRTKFEYAQQYANFRNKVNVSFYGSTPFMCSDWSRWHSQIIVKPKDVAHTTRANSTLQKFGSGWMEMPTDPVTDTSNW